MGDKAINILGVQIRPRLRRVLVEIARQRGMTLEDCVRELLERELELLGRRAA